MNKKIMITFPDGNTRDYISGITGFEIAETISKSLSKKAVAISINGATKDLSDSINCDSHISVITINSVQGLDIMRHTLTAQVLARAVKNLYPKVKLAIGPTINDGFYYDFLFEKQISLEDLPLIEKEMKKIVDTGNLIQKFYKSKKEAINIFSKKNENYKVEIIQNSDQEDNFQVYKQENTEFFDLCRGPHLPSLKFIGAFKLTKLSGAYWRGDSSNEMLQRIYGTAWNNEKDLETHMNMLSEAEKRDHRKLGKAMNYFHFQDDAPGSVFWHSKGWTIFKLLIEYMRKKQEEAGYEEISTPTIMDRSLWEKSGHWEKFSENMYTAKSLDDKNFALKPMNCPGGIQIFNFGIKSYKELPRRIAEFGKVFRFEPSGALHGLMRVREFTQDDAHIYCLESQVEDECLAIIKLTMEIYKDFGFKNIKIKFSDRPIKRIGSDEIWDKLEKSLLQSLKTSGIDYTVNKGEGAFYGPKIEFVLIDAIGRDWQCGTLQVDLNLPPRLGATYVNNEGEKKFPVLLHRAFFGSLERFIGILIENNSGRLPNWLTPLQVVILNINDQSTDYANNIKKRLMDNNIRCKIDFRNEKINYKIREHVSVKIPFIAVIGNKEVSNQSISLRILGEEKIEELSVENFLKKIKNSCRLP